MCGKAGRRKSGWKEKVGIVLKQSRRKFRIKGIALMLAMLMLAGTITACGSKDGNGTKVVLTTGFDKNEVFRIETMSCTLPEIMVYLTNIQNRYEEVYGPQIWEASADGVTLEQNVKDIALAQIARIKTMNLMAGSYGVELTEEEELQAENAAKTYYDSLNETEIEKMGVTEDLIRRMYQEFALAENVYQYTIQDINPEISDDEARTITVQHILIKTYALDGTGKKIGYTQEMKEDAYRRACEVLALAREGKDFDELIRKYNESDKATYSFGKGEMDATFETAAFNLGTGEISDIVETEYGYHIIKCLNTFDKEETDANKVKIVEQRREEAFGQKYDSFVETLARNLNSELWDKVSFLHDEAVTTQSFFEVYNSFFGE